MCKQTRSSIALLCLFCFFSISSVLADSADPADNTATNGTVIIPGVAEQSDGPHTLDTIDSNDWFRCILTAGICYRFESRGEAEGTTVIGASLFADPNSITPLTDTLEDVYPNTDDFSILYRPTNTGTYYLKVQSAPVPSSAAYFLQYSIYDQWDPADNTFTNATVLTMGDAAKVHGPHRVDEFDYDDWYKVHLVTGLLYRFESVGPDDTQAFLYLDPTAVDVAYDDDGSVEFNFRLEYEPAVSGDYYLLVQGYGGGVANYDLQYYIPEKDSDADQLLDSWEQQFFTNLDEGPDGYADGDLYSNLEEYIAGTDPTNSDSFFAVTNWSPGSFIIEWPAFSNRQYQVYRAESLTNIFNPIGPVILYPTNSYTDNANSAEDSGFYKVEVQLQ